MVLVRIILIVIYTENNSDVFIFCGSTDDYFLCATIFDMDIGAGFSTGTECVITVPAAPTFLRGDANDDGSVNVADVVFILNWLFVAGVDPACMDAADVNDDGTIQISDATYLLAFVFSPGPAPPPPFGTPGPDPTDDLLGCLGTP